MGCKGKNMNDKTLRKVIVSHMVAHTNLPKNQRKTMKTNRRPLAVGNVYRYKGYKGNGFRITAMSLPGTMSDDGGSPGVAVKWLNYGRARGWYPFMSESEFWAHMLFNNAVNQEDAET